MEKDSEEKKRRSGISCSRIIGGGCLILIFCCIISVFIIAYKPQSTWSSIVSFLNDGKKVESDKDHSTEESMKFVEDQITTLGKNKVIVPEEYVAPILRKYFQNLSDIQIDIKEDNLRMYWTVDKQQPENPLYGVAEVKVKNKNEIYISHLGFEKVSLPQGLIEKLYASIQNYVKSQPSFNLILEDKNIKITEVKFKEGRIEADIDVTIKIFND